MIIKDNTLIRFQSDDQDMYTRDATFGMLIDNVLFERLVKEKNITKIGKGCLEISPQPTRILNTRKKQNLYLHVQNLVIPEGVQEINEHAFSRSPLQTLTIPESLVNIGDNAFAKSHLSELDLEGSNVKSIGAGAFHGCTNLTQLTIPASVKRISKGTFQGCTGLTQLTIPASVTSIGAQAFQGCTGLTQLTIPASVTSIGAEAFQGCTNLEKIVINTENQDEFVRVRNLIPEPLRALIVNSVDYTREQEESIRARQPGKSILLKPNFPKSVDYTREQEESIRETQIDELISLLECKFDKHKKDVTEEHKNFLGDLKALRSDFDVNPFDKGKLEQLLSKAPEFDNVSPKIFGRSNLAVQFDAFKAKFNKSKIEAEKVAGDLNESPRSPSK